MDLWAIDTVFWGKSCLVAVGALLVTSQVYGLCSLWRAQRPMRYVFKPPLVSCARRVLSLGSHVTAVIRDFSCGRYYKPWKDQKVVVIADLDHIRELSDAPQLSQRAVYADIFGFQYTMSHQATSLDPNEQAPHRYKLFASVIRSIGGAQMQSLHPYLQSRLEQTCVRWMDATPRDAEGWRQVPLAALMRDLATGMLGTYFFGEAMYAEPKFHQAASDFYHDVIRCMAGLPLLPSFAKGIGYRCLTHDGQALRCLFERLAQAIDEPASWQEDEGLKHLTLLHQLHEQSRGSGYWTTALLVQALVGIWFAASHQPWINLHFILLELCARPAYVDALRAEIDAQPGQDMRGMAQMKLLDSFIKECVRLNPLDRMAIRRKAVQPFRFSKNGPTVPTGSIACVSAWDIMHDPTRYPRPDQFDGHRFVGTRTGHGARGTTFTDASREFPIWGFGARVCPGRWHADLVLKLALIHLLRCYDFRLARPDDRHRWWWESFQLPYERTTLLLRPRTAP